MKPFGTESNAHKLLKENAIKQLEQQGYAVYTEYRLYTVKKLWIIDVVGFKGNETVAVECGRTPRCKIEAISKEFTRVTKVTYSSTIYPHKKLKDASRFVATLRIGKATSKIFQSKVVIPAVVARSLEVKDGDKIIWILEDGKWVVEKA